MALPDAAGLDALLARVQAAGHTVVEQADGWRLHDPSGNGIRLVA